MSKIFVTGVLPGDALERLGQFCELDTWSSSEPLSVEVLSERLQGCSGLLCMLTNRINAALLDANPQLRWVSSMSVGVDHIDLPELTSRGIAVGNTPGVLVDTTADLTFALLLAAARRIPEADSYIRDGRWRADQAWSPTMLTGKDVSGATLGIIGLGEIGQAVARRAQGFGMRVLGWTRSGRQVPSVETMGLDELLANADFVSVNVALTAATRGLLDAEAIAKMKPGAVLVNTARGGIVDEAALATALAEERLYAAGIDVFAREPVALDNPLLALPNVVVAPHIGSASSATREQMAGLAADNLIAALTGEPMPHCVNPEVYPRL
ncbi:D-glycerate dehydrogenase [Halieaceae bacterium IMCC14734]|uniref:D-glycerate dehydrogenase n=1 Tax=Candidatus Litorirhabdus singularis TaxID=2518993 RepID=A0ABT3TDE9_9GAMM|nr:D-glycerate dehydrogenase [Candidatus Litorirhabdus singularis]MCX2980289.1 D-glycerate dehydrogenase [Candidatus Litorirhabdus singularis]